MSIGLAVVSPLSRKFPGKHRIHVHHFIDSTGGSVTLSSNNPFDPPLIDPGLLTNDFDLFSMKEAIKRAQKFVTAPVFKDYIIGPTENLQNMSADALEQHIRNRVSSTSHLVGSAGMSARDAHYGVVDPDLLVKGVHGLRIIDASVLVTKSHSTT